MTVDDMTNAQSVGCTPWNSQNLLRSSMEDTGKGPTYRISLQKHEHTAEGSSISPVLQIVPSGNQSNCWRVECWHV